MEADRCLTFGDFSLDVPSVGRLLAWLDRPLAKTQADPGSLTVRAAFESAGAKVNLKKASVTGKAMQIDAKGSFDAGKPTPRFDLDVNIVKADVDAYLPPAEKQPAKAAPAVKGKSDWSDEPYDFSGLKAVDGKAAVTISSLTYKGLAIKKGRIDLTLEKGIAKTKLTDLALTGGTINAATVLDGSGKAAKLSYNLDVKNVEARPLLKAFADFDRLSGKANITAEGASSGRTQRELVKALNGKGSIQFLNGAIHGINVAATLRKAGSLGMNDTAGSAQKTDFAELGGTYVIKNGIVDNRDFKLLAPLLRITGEGRVPMPPRTVNYKVVAKLVGTLKGQGGKDALAGLPIPIKITRGWDKPKFDVDWDSVLKSIAADPARLSKLPGALSDKAKDLGIALPKAGSAGKVLKGLTGDTSGSGDSTTPTTDKKKKVKDLLNSITK